MNENQNKESLKEKLESIRVDKYPDVPSELVSKIIDLQSSDRKNTAKTRKLIEEAIIEYSNVATD